MAVKAGAHCRAPNASQVCGSDRRCLRGGARSTAGNQGLSRSDDGPGEAAPLLTAPLGHDLEVDCNRGQR